MFRAPRRLHRTIALPMIFCSVQAQLLANCFAFLRRRVPHLVPDAAPAVGVGSHGAPPFNHLRHLVSLLLQGRSIVGALGGRIGRTSGR